MTKEELIVRFERLMLLYPPQKAIMKYFEKALSAGAIDYAWEKPESYKSAELIYYAILKTLAEEWRPETKQDLKSANNVALFL